MLSNMRMILLIVSVFLDSFNEHGVQGTFHVGLKHYTEENNINRFLMGLEGQPLAGAVVDAEEDMDNLGKTAAEIV